MIVPAGVQTQAQEAALSSFAYGQSRQFVDGLSRDGCDPPTHYLCVMSLQSDRAATARLVLDLLGGRVFEGVDVAAALAEAGLMPVVPGQKASLLQRVRRKLP